MNPIRWCEIYVQDMARAKAFYEKVFQFELMHLPNPDSMTDSEMWAFPMSDTSPGASGALVKMQGVPSGGSTLIYFASKDCTTELSRVVAAGGSIFRDKFSIGPFGFIGLFTDTEGNMIGVHSSE